MKSKRYFFLVNSLIITLAVLVHYEFLYRLSINIPKMKIKHRFRIVIGIFGALIAHSIEIVLFSIMKSNAIGIGPDQKIEQTCLSN